MQSEEAARTTGMNNPQMRPFLKATDLIPEDRKHLFDMLILDGLGAIKVYENGDCRLGS